MHQNDFKANCASENKEKSMKAGRYDGLCEIHLFTYEKDESCLVRFLRDNNIWSPLRLLGRA